MTRQENVNSLDTFLHSKDQLAFKSLPRNAALIFVPPFPFERASSNFSRPLLFLIEFV